MDGQGIGVLHPGAMGAAVAAQAVAAGHRVYWVADGRGAATRERAGAAGLNAVRDVAELARRSWLIVSVCPPAAATEVARAVGGTSFGGVYLEANAVDPERTKAIAGLLPGARVVDGGIVGGPPEPGGDTRLFLSGPDAETERVRAVFAGTALTPVVLPGPLGRASALKLSFAAYNKITYALAAQACALAAGHGVLDELLALTAEVLPRTPLGRAERVATAGPRAWRWEPEMGEIAAACDAAGVPSDLVRAAAGIFERWRGHKDDHAVTLERLVADLSGERPRGGSAAG